MKNIYLPKKAVVLAVQKENFDTATLFLKMEGQADFEFLPGQFMMIGLAGFGESAISISSDSRQSKKFISLTIRSVGNLTQALNELKKGDVVLVRGPFGNGFPEINGETILIGGGCGFIPLRSVIASNVERLADLRIFVGCATAKNLVFTADLAEWEKKISVKVIFEKEIHEDIYPEKGYITDLLSKEILNPKAKAFVCGPLVMYAKTAKILLQKGLSAENIFFSLEKRMHCGIGVCQHCAIGPKYVCKDGPVFDLQFLLTQKYFVL
ncbi:MAG: FAD/NAD(P)-binding protein [Patescibacteria group bacterium]